MGQHHSLPENNVTLQCVTETPDTLYCENISIPFTFKEEMLGVRNGLFWAYLCGYIGLVLFAGMMSGLTLAILSLDVTQLIVMMNAEEKSSEANVSKQFKYAQRILPLASRHHVVLVALVIANSLAVEAMPLVLDKIAGEIVAMATSVTAVLLFGEVLPQAICSRYGLAIGYYMAWMVWGLIGLFCYIAYPVAWLLDFLLGKEHATFYRRAELAALVDMHGPSYRHPSCGSGSRSRSLRKPLLTEDEVKIIRAALLMTSKHAGSLIRQSIDDAYMLPIEACFDEQTLRQTGETSGSSVLFAQLMLAGHSRIPVYENCDRNRVVQVLLVKKLILVNPVARIPVQEAIAKNINGAFTAPYFVDENESVHNMLDYFQKGNTHIAFVRRHKPPGEQAEIKGIVTLEDIVEMLLQDEIWDETDNFRKTVAKKPESLRFVIPCPKSSPRCAAVHTPKDAKTKGAAVKCRRLPRHDCKLLKEVVVRQPEKVDEKKKAEEKPNEKKKGEETKKREGPK